MRMKISAKNMKEIVEILKALVDETKIELDEEGMKIKAIDPGHVAMATVELSREGFVEYEVNEKNVIGIDLNKIIDFLKNINEDIEIIVDGNKATLNAGYLSKTMALLDPGNITVPMIKNLELPNKVVLETKELRAGIRAGENVTDNMMIQLSPEGLRLIAKGEEDKTELFLPKEILKELECKSEAKSTYPMDYLLAITKPISSENITVNLDTDRPMKIEFDICDGKGKVNYLLAPRIE
ncbi:MAG: DNA polymerase sliding clamp [Euryarchaeota archaeon]|nr:DNA polymerase sliding clamp [Euryarchaeota archaeon]